MPAEPTADLGHPFMGLRAPAGAEPPPAVPVAGPRAGAVSQPAPAPPDVSFEVVQRRAVKAAEPWLSRPSPDDRSGAFEPMQGAFEGIGYRLLSEPEFEAWQGTVQARQMHGVAAHDGMVAVTQFASDSDVLQQAGFLEGAKGYLLIAEGVLAIAAGIALCAGTAGAGVVPGILAIVTGVIKVVRGFLTIKWGGEASAKQKAILDSIRAVEAVVALSAAAVTGNVGIWIFAVAKSLRSLFTLITDQMGDDSDARVKLGLQRLSAGLQLIEALALGGVGAGALAGAEGAAGVAVGAAGLGTAASKLTRGGDQTVAAAPSAETGWA